MTSAAPLAAFPEAWLDRRWVSEDGRLYLVIRRAADERRRERFPLEVDVGRLDGAGTCLSAAPACFLPRQDEEAKAGSARLDRVQVELGIEHVGPTYSLLLARPSDDRTRWHGYDWVALRADTPVEQVALFPEYGGTPYGPAEDDWDWQEGWWYPYSTFRLAR